MCMSARVDELLLEAMGLGEHERADLAARLIASLDDDLTEDAAEGDAAWDAEIVVRAARVHAGETTTEWSAVRRQLLRSHEA